LRDDDEQVRDEAEVALWIDQSLILNAVSHNITASGPADGDPGSPNHMDDEPNGEIPAIPADIHRALTIDIHTTPHSEKSLNRIRNKAEMKEYPPSIPSEIEQEVPDKPKANSKSGDSDSKKRRRLPYNKQTNLELHVVQQAKLDSKRAKRKDSAQPLPATSPFVDEDANNGGGCTRILRSRRTSLGTFEPTRRSGRKKLGEAEKKKQKEETKNKEYVVEKLHDWGLEPVKRHLQILIKWADDEDGTPYPDP